MATFYVRYSGGLPQGEQWVTGIHLNGGTLDLVVASMGDAFDAFWSAVGPFYVPEVTVVSGVAYTLDAATGKATARGEATVGDAGTSVGEAMPDATCVVATLRTATPGAAGRGRMYWPAPDMGGFSDGLISSGVAGNYADAVKAMLDVFSGSSLDPCLFTPGKANRLITSVDVSEVPGQQRRRRNKIIAPRHVGS